MTRSPCDLRAAPANSNIIKPLSVAVCVCTQSIGNRRLLLIASKRARKLYQCQTVCRHSPARAVEPPADKQRDREKRNHFSCGSSQIVSSPSHDEFH